MKPITAYSWGYYGWGNYTAEFKEEIDRLERKRKPKRRPPVFVDIRYHRTGLAPEFVGDAFEKTVGKDRYRWMQGLGNIMVSGQVESDSNIVIAAPSYADELLDVIVAANRAKRRVLFFCSCKFPNWPHNDDRHASPCHRTEVARLLINAARRRGQPLTVIEWPGEENRHDEFSVSVDRSEFRKVMNGNSLVTIEARDRHKFFGLPWASRVTVRCEDSKDETAVIAGPAHVVGKGKAQRWYLPVLEPKARKRPKAAADLKSEADKWHRKYGFHPHHAKG